MSAFFHLHALLCIKMPKVKKDLIQSSEGFGCQKHIEKVILPNIISHIPKLPVIEIFTMRGTIHSTDFCCDYISKLLKLNSIFVQPKNLFPILRFFC
jgi:hypothetical protein